MGLPQDEDMIRCDGIWKIFDAQAQRAMAAVRSDGLGKKEIAERFDCVVGVQDASFSVRRGEIFCIMGLSGSGKSTLIRHINRLIEPTAGTVHTEGENVSAMSARELRALRAERIGMVFQNMALMPHRTVRDNVGFSLEVRGRPEAERVRVADRAIEAVELAGWQHRYPDELSGGMQQRVRLAPAIAADPTILLMDEPFSALDPLIRKQLQTVFMELSAELHKTTLFITHDLDEAIRVGDRIAIMKDGVLVQIGTPEEIVTSPADDYVADFVAGISRLDLVTAAHVMQPIDHYHSEEGPADMTMWPVAAPGDKLNALIDLSIGSDHPVVVRADTRDLGVVTRRALLRGIQGQSESARSDVGPNDIDRSEAGASGMSRPGRRVC